MLTGRFFLLGFIFCADQTLANLSLGGNGEFGHHNELNLSAYLCTFLPMTLSVDLWSDIVVQAFYQGFLATIIQMIFYVRAVQLIGPSSMGALMAIVPVLSGVAALFVFQEPVTFALCTAFVLVSLGAWCASGKLLLPRVGAPREKENSEETLVQ